MANESIILQVQGTTRKGKPWIMNFPFWVTADDATIAASTLRKLAEEFYNTYVTGSNGLYTLLPEDCTILGVTGRNYIGGGYWPGQVSAGPLDGTRPLGSLPEGVGPTIILRATPAPPARLSFTRVYMPAISEADQDNGSIDASLVDSIITWVGSFWNITAAGGSAARLSIISRLNGTQKEVTNVTVSDRLARIVRRGNSFQGRAS